MFCKSSQKNDLDIKLCDSIAEVNNEDWAEVISTSNIFMSKPYLEILEGDSGYGMQFRYALIYKDDQPVAAGYFQVVDFSGEELRPYIPQKSSDSKFQKFNHKFHSILEQGLSRINWKLLVSGNIFATGECGFHYLPEKIDTQIAYAVLKEVMDLISTNSETPEKIKVFLIKDFYLNQTNGDASLIKNNFRKLIIESDMFLDVAPEWESFDDYMDSISSKYRVRAKKIFKKSKSLVQKELSADEIITYKEEIFKLYMNVARRANFNLAYLTSNYFQDIKTKFQDDFVLVGYFLNEKLVGFISNFIANDELEVHFVGLDYEYNRSHCVYQKILYDDIQLAIDSNLKRIHYGRTAQEIKSTVGARPREMYGYLKHKNIVPNLVIKPLTGYMKPQEWIVRNPFKGNSYAPA